MKFVARSHGTPKRDAYRNRPTRHIVSGANFNSTYAQRYFLLATRSVVKEDGSRTDSSQRNLRIRPIEMAEATQILPARHQKLCPVARVDRECE